MNIKILIYCLILSGLVFSITSLSNNIIIKSYELPVTNINNYNKNTVVTNFIYIPSKIVEDYSCVYSITCGNIVKKGKFSLQSNEIKIINVTLIGLYDPIICHEDFVCTSETNSVALGQKTITVYPFFETPPDQGEPYIVTNEYWILKQSNPIFIINNQSSEYVCKLKINNLEYNLDLKPGEIKEIKYSKNPILPQIVKNINNINLECSFTYDKQNKIKESLVTYDIPYHKLEKLDPYISMDVQKNNHGFKITISSLYSKTVLCMVKVNDVEEQKNISFLLVLVPSQNEISNTYSLSNLGFQTLPRVTIKIYIDCFSMYTTHVKRNYTLTYQYTDSDVEKYKLKYTTNELLDNSIKLYQSIYKYANTLNIWECGNYMDKVSQIKQELKQIKNSNPSTNMINNLESLILDETSLKSKLKNKILTIKNEYETDRDKYISLLNHVLNLYSILQQNNCRISVQWNTIEKLEDYSTKLNLNINCQILGSFSRYMSQLEYVNKTLTNDEQKCNIKNVQKTINKELLEKIQRLCKNISIFKNKFQIKYKGKGSSINQIIYIPIYKSLCNEIQQCNKLYKKVKTADISEKVAELDYKTLKTSYNNIYNEVILNIMSYITNFYSTFGVFFIYYPKYSKYEKKINGYYADILIKVTSNKDLIQFSNGLINDLNNILSIIKKVQEIGKNIIIKVTDYTGSPIIFAKVYVNNKFIGLTDGNGIITTYVPTGMTKISIFARDYKKYTGTFDVNVNNQIINIKLSPTKIKYGYPESLYHYITSIYTAGGISICSTLNSPICTKDKKYKDITRLYAIVHPYSKEIQSLVSKIPKYEIDTCKDNGNCIPLLRTVEKIVKSEIKYNRNCVAPHTSKVEIRKGCMAWWGSDLGILKYHSGVCADFATLTVSLLRAIGIPVRYVEIIGVTKKNLVKFYGKSFKHAFTMVYIDNHWVFYDALWNYIGKPNYPLKCVNFTGSPNILFKNGIVKIVYTNLNNYIKKYYSLCPKTSPTKNPMELPIQDPTKYNCLIFLNNKTVECLVNDTSFAIQALNFNSWMNISKIEKGLFERTLVIGKLWKNTISFYLTPGTSAHILICGLNDSIVVSPNFYAINKTCVYYNLSGIGVNSIIVSQYPTFYSDNFLLQTAAILYNYIIINNSSSAMVTDEPVNFTQIYLSGDINKQLSTLFIIKEHECPSGIDVINNLNLQSIESIITNNSESQLVLVNTTNVSLYEYNLYELCKRKINFKPKFKNIVIFPITPTIIKLLLLLIPY